MDIVYTRNRDIGVQRFDIQQHGRIVWATNAGKFNRFLSWLIKASQIILYFNTTLKATLYIVGVLAISFLFYILNFQDTIIADRLNPVTQYVIHLFNIANSQDTVTAARLNPVTQYFLHLFSIFNFQDTITAGGHNPVTQYFINQSWTLSLILLGPYNIMTGNVYTIRNDAIVCAHILRLVHGTVWCWSMLIFNRINTVLATCSLEQHTNPNACFVAGGHWYKFNISPDIFLLIHCALAISEEVKTFKPWNRLGVMIFGPRFRVIDFKLFSGRRVIMQSVKVNAQKDFNKYTPIVTVIVVFLALLLLMFDFLLVMSVIYNNHTTGENSVAAILAIFGWYINYRIWDRICRQNDRHATVQVI